MHAVQVGALTAYLLRRVHHIEQLRTTKLKAAASLLWALAAPPDLTKSDAAPLHADAPNAATLHAADNAGGTSIGIAHGDGAARARPPLMETLLHKYFLEEVDLEGAGWAAPFRSRALPFTLRSDILDFVSTHFAEANTSKRAAADPAPLTGRAVARILHRIHSPAFPKKQWLKTRFWGLHREVLRAVSLVVAHLLPARPAATLLLALLGSMHSCSNHAGAADGL